ncbi:MAG: hypothetical protein CFE21_12660 [Bacteroidetes bacterium B1(2017)]|nr:MAG: hypothetical protein CFE21_12660 [Bacteroidetes bacterium B1(2017)]
MPNRSEKKRILIVEDDAIISRNMFDFLVLNGYEVRLGNNGLMGLEIVQTFIPDLILCDIMMPEMDGYTFFKEYTKKYPFQNSLFIFVTAKNVNSDMRFGMNLGADDYIVKPFQLDHLAETIRVKFGKLDNLKSFLQGSSKKKDTINTFIPIREVNNCVTSIIGGSQLLIDSKKNNQDLDLQHVLFIINSCGLRLNKGINNLVLGNEFQKNTLVPFIETIDSKFIESIIKSIALSYNRISDLTLLVSTFEEDLNLDKYLLRKVLEELADNSFKFTTHGIKINWEIKVENGFLDFKVIYNTGNFTAKCFNEIAPFKQFFNEAKTNPGLGYGLYITKKIISYFNGSIEFGNIFELGKFSVLIPANFSLPRKV